MAAVRLPPARERKRPNGDGFAPRPMIRAEKGAPPKGGRRGENQGGGNRSPPSPRRAQNPHRAAGAGTTARPQPRRRRDAERERGGAAPGRAHIPRAQRAEHKTYLQDAPVPRSFPQIQPPSGEIKDYGAGTDPGIIFAERTTNKPSSNCTVMPCSAIFFLITFMLACTSPETS